MVFWVGLNGIFDKWNYSVWYFSAGIKWKFDSNQKCGYFWVAWNVIFDSNGSIFWRVPIHFTPLYTMSQKNLTSSDRISPSLSDPDSTSCEIYIKNKNVWNLTISARKKFRLWTNFRENLLCKKWFLRIFFSSEELDYFQWSFDCTPLD